MTNGGVDRSVECTGNINAMIQAFECVHDVRTLFTHSIERIPSFIQTEVLTTLLLIQGWGVAVLVGVPHKDAEFKTHPMNFLNERTLKGTFFGNYKPRTDLPNVVELYMKKVNAKSCFFSSPATLLVDPLLKLLAISPPAKPCFACSCYDSALFARRSWRWRSSSRTASHSRRSTRPST